MTTRTYGNLMSTAIGLALLAAHTGCGPPPAVREFNQAVAATKGQHDASKIKAVVLPLLATNVPAEKHVPIEIRSLPLFAQEGSTIDTWAVSDSHGNHGLAFVTGSGFGHWGIVVCPFEGGERAAKTLHGTVTPWQDGVFFWIER